MKQCPKCGGDTHISNSRERKDGTEVGRRRDCLSCGHHFRTVERIHSQPPPKQNTFAWTVTPKWLSKLNDLEIKLLHDAVSSEIAVRQIQAE